MTSNEDGAGGVRRLEILAVPGIPRIEAGDDLAHVILSAIGLSGLSLMPDDVVVVAQKIVSKAEGRFVRLCDVEPTARASELAARTGKDPRLVQLILSETREVLRCETNLIIVEDRRGLVLANAGIDASNVVATDRDETVLLLPEDPDASAGRLRLTLGAATGCEVGVIINDSIGRAWRNGTIGTAIGVSGLPGLVDLRGTPDLFGRVLRTTDIGLADEAAAAASIMMGQAGEGYPVILIRGLPYPRREGRAGELVRPKSMDLFR